MGQEEKKGWNPYIAGALTGLLLIFSVLFTGKYVGASMTFVRSAGYIERVFNAERVAKMEYFKKKLPKIDWQFLFVVGIFVGALLSSTTSQSFRWQAVPSRWQERFGPAVPKRAVAAHFYVKVIFLLSVCPCRFPERNQSGSLLSLS